MGLAIHKCWLVLGLAMALGVGLAVAADQRPADNQPVASTGETKPAPAAKKADADQAGSEAKGEPSGQAKPATPPAVPRIAPDEGC